MKKGEKLFQRQGQIGILFFFFGNFRKMEHSINKSSRRCHRLWHWPDACCRCRTEAGGVALLSPLHPPQSLSFDSYYVSLSTGPLVASDKCLVPPLALSLPVCTHRIYRGEASHFVKRLKWAYWCYRNDPGLLILELLAPKDTHRYLITLLFCSTTWFSYLLASPHHNI